MKHKAALILFLLIIISFSSFSQGKKYIYYFDNDLNPASKSKSTITGTGIAENGLVKVVCTVNNTSQVVMVAYFTDSSMKINHGLSELYFSNGNKASAINYDKGKEDGLSMKWDNAGRLTDSTIYVQGEKITESRFRYKRNGHLISTDLNDIKNDKEQIYHYNDSGRIVSEVNFTGNTGILKQYNADGVKLDTVYSKEEKEASFAGGDAAWARYIKIMIEQNINELTRDNQSGTCRLRFIIDKDGNPKNVEALTMKGSKLAEVAVNAIANGPKWTPAVQYGRKVNAYREQPVTFTISR